MSLEGYIKLEAFNWKKLYHDLLKYKSRDYFNIYAKITSDS